jgi:hypothetical protein
LPFEITAAVLKLSLIFHKLRVFNTPKTLQTSLPVQPEGTKCSFGADRPRNGLQLVESLRSSGVADLKETSR